MTSRRRLPYTGGWPKRQRRPVKTKAYKLAAELGLQEHSVLEWLRENGYPNARRADTIRSEVAQAARQALGRAAGVRTLHSGNRASVTRAVVARPPRNGPMLGCAN